MKAAVDSMPRALQYIAHPSKELLRYVVDRGWNNLSLIDNPDDELIHVALAQSGWAIQYIPEPSEELQLLAVTHNYDAIKFLDHPSEAVQMAAVKENYQALRYIQHPALSAILEAVRQDARAARLVTDLDEDTALAMLTVNCLVGKYLPPSLVIDVGRLTKALQDVVADPDVDESYIRHLVSSRIFDVHAVSFPMNPLLIIDTHGSAKARRVAMDEKLKF